MKSGKMIESLMCNFCDVNHKIDNFQTKRASRSFIE